MKGVKVAIAASVALMAVVGALTLTRAPLRVVGARAEEKVELTSSFGQFAACQLNEALPAGVSAIRLSLESPTGPAVRVRVYSGSRLLTQGTRAAGWAGGAVTVPVKPLDHGVSDVMLCFNVLANSERLQVVGTPAAAPEPAVLSSGKLLLGRFGFEYLAPGRGSWWSRALSVARHMGIGHAVSGTWVALLVAALTAAVGALALGLAWRELP